MNTIFEYRGVLKNSLSGNVYGAFPMETMRSWLGRLCNLRVQRHGNHEGHATYVGPDGRWAHFQQQMAQFTFAWLVRCAHLALCRGLSGLWILLTQNDSVIYMHSRTHQEHWCRASLPFPVVHYVIIYCLYSATTKPLTASFHSMTTE